MSKCLGLWLVICVVRKKLVTPRGGAAARSANACIRHCLMGDHLRTDKQPRHRTKHPSLLSLSHPSLHGYAQMSTPLPSYNWVSKQAHRVIY